MGLLTQKSNAIQGKRQNFTIDIPDIQVQKVSLITNIVISKKNNYLYNGKMFMKSIYIYKYL